MRREQLAVTDQEATAIKKHRRSQEDEESLARWRELLRRCPDFDDYAGTVDRLARLIPRPSVDSRVRADWSPIDGLYPVDYWEMLYLAAKHATFARPDHRPPLPSAR